MSFFKEALSNIGNTVAGNIQKGIIEIIDLRPTNMQREMEKAVSAGGTSYSSSMPLGTTAAKFASDNIGGALVSDDLQLHLLDSMISKANVNFSRKRFTVQFNPSEIRLSGYGGGLYSKMEFGQDSNTNGKLVFTEMNPRITLELNIIFDEADPQEAFMAEPFSMTASSAVKTVAKGIQKAAGLEKKVTVQDKAEAFTAALRNERTRFVTFYWGDICYSGTLIRVTVNYTMFDIAGVPIRATVGLSIVCIDDQADESEAEVWEKYCEKVFAMNGSLTGKATGAASRLGNVLNINL